MSDDPYPVIDATEWEPIDLETGGGNEGQWRRDRHGTDWFFKPRTEHPGWVQGEDWAEKIAAEYAHMLGVPAAHVELAEVDGRRGSISRSVRPASYELQPGAVLLAGVVEDFETGTKERRGHTLGNIRCVLDGVEAPIPFGAGDGAFDVFAGYLVLDALIANQDRHEENWAVLISPEGTTSLCPSYDHAASFGYQRQDAFKQRALEDVTSLRTFCSRGRAQRLERDSDGRLTLVEAAASAVRMAGAHVRDRWRAAIEGLDLDACEIVVARTPGMSDVARTFVLEMTRINAERLSHEL